MYDPKLAQKILEFKHVYALCKIHGTSSHLAFDPATSKISYFAGGASHLLFTSLFDESKLLPAFQKWGRKVKVYGEAYGGSMQRMKATYGDKLQFIAFEVQFDDTWLNVPSAEKVVLELGLEFVPYTLIETTVENLNAERDADSIVAIRRGMGSGKKREGIVIRPPFEVMLAKGDRLIAKHKRDDFQEVRSKREITTDEKVKIFDRADEIANEFVNARRLEHVIQHLQEKGIAADSIQYCKQVIDEMVKDVLEEGSEEIRGSQEVIKVLSKKAVEEFKRYLKNQAATTGE